MRTRATLPRLCRGRGVVAVARAKSRPSAPKSSKAKPAAGKKGKEKVVLKDLSQLAALLGCLRR